MNIDKIYRDIARLKRQVCCLQNSSNGSDTNDFSVAQTVTDVVGADPTTSQGVIWDGVGIYTFTEDNLTDNGYSILPSITVPGGHWVLQNSAPGAPELPTEYGTLLNVPAGGVTDGNVDVTKNGALLTATITKAGNFDKFAVTAGDDTSWIKFDRLTTQDNAITLRAVIICNTVGATSPQIGLGFRGLNLTHDTTGAIWYNQMIVNLLAKTAVHKRVNGTLDAATVVTSAGTLAANGDTLELIFGIDLDLSAITLTVNNLNTGEFLYATIVFRARNLTFQTRQLALILTDGTYTLLEYKAVSSVPKGCFLAIMGDSYACGDLLWMFETLNYKFRATFPEYTSVCLAGNGAYVISMSQYQLQDVLRLKPRYVLMVSVLSVFYGFFDDGDANQIEFDNNMTKILNGITSYGGIPIFAKWQAGTNGFLNGNGGAWNAKVDTMIATYPTSLVLNLTGENLDLNNSSHPTIADVDIIVKDLSALFA